MDNKARSGMDDDYGFFLRSCQEQAVAQVSRAVKTKGVANADWGGVPVSSGIKSVAGIYRHVVDLDWNKQRCRTNAAGRLAFAYHGTASAP